MWSWLTGGKKDEPAHNTINHTKVATYSNHHSGSSKQTPPVGEDLSAHVTSPAAAAAPTTAPTSVSSSNDPDLKPPSAPPTEGGFWGFTDTDVTADHDPALDDMMSFFGFSHRERESDYVGCVSFELTYPDGKKSIRSVQILPKTKEIKERITIEEVKEDETKKGSTVVARKPASMVLFTRAQLADPNSPSSSPELMTRNPSWFARMCRPVCTLHMPPRRASEKEEAISSSSSSATTASKLPPLPTLPFSSRVRIHEGPLPSDVKPTARLLCNRSIFFDVYLGRLDPITSVFTGRAHCPGMRYYELRNFGLSFEMQPSTWSAFYEKQAEIEEAKKERAKLLGGATKEEKKEKRSDGGGGKGGGSGGMAQLTSASQSSSATPASPSTPSKSSSLLSSSSSFSTSSTFSSSSSSWLVSSTLPRFVIRSRRSSSSSLPSHPTPDSTGADSHVQPPRMVPRWQNRLEDLLTTIQARAATTMHC